MVIRYFVIQAVFLSSLAMAQSAPASQLPSKTALPIVFTSTVDADHVKVGDTVLAKTIQVVKIPGLILPSGTFVRAHVVAATPAPKRWSCNQPSDMSELGIHFDQISTRTTSFPLDVYVRAIADSISSWTAVEPYGDTKWDPDSTVIQVGGDILTPSQTDVVSRNGRIVARNTKGGVFGRLQAGNGDSPDGCDASNSEESLAIFSAFACGPYGFSEVQMKNSIRTADPSMLLLASRSGPVKIWKQSTALLEVR